VSENARTEDGALQCRSCDAEFIAGTTLCAECLGTDLVPSQPAVPPNKPHAFLYFWLLAPALGVGAPHIHNCLIESVVLALRVS